MGFFQKQSEYQADTNSVEFDRLQNRENVVIVIEMNMEREILTVCVSFHRKDDKKGQQTDRFNSSSCQHQQSRSIGHQRIA